MSAELWSPGVTFPMNKWKSRGDNRWVVAAAYWSIPLPLSPIQYCSPFRGVRFLVRCTRNRGEAKTDQQVASNWWKKGSCLSRVEPVWRSLLRREFVSVCVDLVCAVARDLCECFLPHLFLPHVWDEGSEVVTVCCNSFSVRALDSRCLSSVEPLTSVSFVRVH